jgi:hypothetical protein
MTGAPQRKISASAADGIARRLADLGDVLQLPGRLTREGHAPSEEQNVKQRVEYVRNLALHDPGVLLERHGALLSAADRALFEPLRHEQYEVDFYLRFLEPDPATSSASPAPSPSPSARTKNRRLAHLRRLASATDFFSDDAMRRRQPGLHHLYVGQYLPEGDLLPAEEEPAGGERGGAALLARSLMRQQEEVDVRVRREAELERWQLQESEEEGEEEEEEGEGRERRPGAAVRIPEEER